MPIDNIICEFLKKILYNYYSILCRSGMFVSTSGKHDWTPAFAGRLIYGKLPFEGHSRKGGNPVLLKKVAVPEIIAATVRIHTSKGY